MKFELQDRVFDRTLVVINRAYSAYLQWRPLTLIAERTTERYRFAAQLAAPFTDNPGGLLARVAYKRAFFMAGDAAGMWCPAAYRNCWTRLLKFACEAQAWRYFSTCPE